MQSPKVFEIGHRCFYFSKAVLAFVRECKYDRIHHSIFDQLIRSATSIGANIIEARAGSSKKDWRKYYLIALKSANETKYWLCLIRDSLDVDNKEITDLLIEANSISKIIASIIVNSMK